MPVSLVKSERRTSSDFIQQQLQLITERKLDKFEIFLFEAALEKHRSFMGDHLQYALYKLLSPPTSCKLSESDIIIKLTDICYCRKSVSNFKSLPLFVGTISNLLVYFLNGKLWEKAVSLMGVLQTKAIELQNDNDSGIKKKLVFMHASLVKHVTIVPVEHVEKLLSASITPLKHYSKLPEADVSTRLYKSCLYVIQNQICNNLDVMVAYLNEAAKLIAFHKSAENENGSCHIFSQVYLNIISDQLLRKTVLKKNELEAITVKIRIYLNLKNREGDFNLWEVLMSFLWAPVSTQIVKLVKPAAESLKSLLKGEASSPDDLALITVVMNYGLDSWLRSENWPKCVDSQFMEFFFNNFIKLIWEKSSLSKSYLMNDPYGELRHLCLYEVMGKLLYTFLALTRISIKCELWKNSSATLLTDINVKSFLWCYDCFKGSLENGCSEIVETNMWNNLAVISLNNVESLLVLGSKNNDWKPLKVVASHVAQIICSSGRSVPVDDNRIQLVFDRWFYACRRLRDWTDAFMCCAIQLILRPQDLKIVIRNWTRSLISSAENDILFVDFLEKNQELLEPYGKVPADKSFIYLEEMESYNYYGWKISLSNVKKCLEYVKKTSTTLTWKSRAMCALMNVCSRCFPDQSIMKKICEFSNELIALLLQKSKNCKKEKNLCEYKMLCGRLELSIFSHDLKMQNFNQCEKNNQIEVCLEDNKGNDAIVLDLPVLSYPRCTLKTEEKLLDKLQNILLHWRDAAGLIDSPTLDDIIQDWLTQLEVAAHFAYLLGDSAKSIQFWLIYYKIAKVTDSASQKLNALNSLIEKCNVAETSALVAEAFEAAKHVSDAFNKNMFYFAVANLHLNHKNAKSAFDALNEIVSITEEDSWQYFAVDGLKMYYLTKLCCLSKEYGAIAGVAHIPYSAMSAFQSIKKSFEILGTSAGCYSHRLYILIRLLEVGLWCCEVSLTVGLTRNIKSCLKGLLSFFEAHGFMTSTMEIGCCLMEFQVSSNLISSALQTLDHIACAFDFSSISEFYKEETNRKSEGSIKRIRLKIIRMIALSYYAYITGFNPQTREICIESLKKVHTTLNNCAGNEESVEIQRNFGQIFPLTDISLHEGQVNVAKCKAKFVEFTIQTTQNLLIDELLKDAENLLNSLSYQKSLLIWRFMELKLCLYILRERKESIKDDKSPVCNMIVNEKTVHTPKNALLNKGFVLKAPKKFQDDKSDLSESIDSLTIGRKVDFDNVLQHNAPIDDKRKIKSKNTPKEFLKFKTPAKTIERPIGGVKIRNLVDAGACRTPKLTKIPQASSSTTKKCLSVKSKVKPLSFDILADDEPETRKMETRSRKQKNVATEKTKNYSSGSVDLFESFEQRQLNQ